LILLLDDGLTWAEIRDRLFCNDAFISRWSRRFGDERLAGLFSRQAGQPARKLTPVLEARILERTLRRKPEDGSTHWSTRKLGRALGVSHMMVARVWAKHGIKPHRLEHYMVSNDPEFEAKAADIIGLYRIRRPMRRCFAWTKKRPFKRWTAWIPPFLCRPDAPSGTGLNTPGMAPCPCTQHSTPGPAK
jgi:transposase